MDQEIIHDAQGTWQITVHTKGNYFISSENSGASHWDSGQNCLNKHWNFNILILFSIFLGFLSESNDLKTKDSVQQKCSAAFATVKPRKSWNMFLAPRWAIKQQLSWDSKPGASCGEHSGGRFFMLAALPNLQDSTQDYDLSICKSSFQKSIFFKTNGVSPWFHTVNYVTILTSYLRHP